MAAYKQKKKDAGEESTEDDEPANASKDNSATHTNMFKIPRRSPPKESNCQSTPNAPPSLDELLADVSEPRINDSLNQVPVNGEKADGTASRVTDQVDPAALKRKRQGD